jgi:hypothetical protein
LFSLKSDRKILWHVDRQTCEPKGKDRLGKWMKRQLTDRFRKRMKRQADRQVREEDEGKVTDRFRKRMKRQGDR